MSSTSNKGGRGEEIAANIDTLGLRQEAEARFRIRNLEKELAPTRLEPSTLTELAQALGAGNSLILHDRTGAPFALATVRAPRMQLQGAAVVQAYATAIGEAFDYVRAKYSLPGSPYWEFKEATL